MHACSDEIIQPIKVTTLGRITFHVMTFSKGWVPGTETPKIQTLPEWGGGLTLALAYLTFSLSKMIYALLSKNVASRIYAILWAKSLRMPGLGGVGVGGGQPNLGNAWILGVSVPASHP